MFQSALLLFILMDIIASSGELISQTFPIQNANKDIGVIYTMSIIADNSDPQLNTMTLSMTAPETIWMGVILGTQHMDNASSYVYYLNDSLTGEWVFAERYFLNELDAGQLIEIIDATNYQVITQNATTTLTYTRPWIGSHQTSFNLTHNDTIFEYGFAKGVSGVLAYHDRERSHSTYTLLHTENTIIVDDTQPVVGNTKPVIADNTTLVVGNDTKPVVGNTKPPGIVDGSRPVIAGNITDIAENPEHTPDTTDKADNIIVVDDNTNSHEVLHDPQESIAVIKSTKLMVLLVSLSAIFI